MKGNSHIHGATPYQIMVHQNGPRLGNEKDQTEVLDLLKDKKTGSKKIGS